MKAYGGSSSLAPHILNLSTWYRSVINITPRPLYPHLIKPVAVEYNSGWSQSQIIRFGGSKSGRPTNGLAAVQTGYCICVPKDYDFTACCLCIPEYPIFTISRFDGKRKKPCGRLRRRWNNRLYIYVWSLYVYVWLPSLRFFRAFSSVVRQMPG